MDAGNPPTGLYVWALDGAIPSMRMYVDRISETEAHRLMDEMSWEKYYTIRAHIHSINLLWTRLAEEVPAERITSFSPEDAAFLLNTISRGMTDFRSSARLQRDPTRALMDEELSRGLLAEHFLGQKSTISSVEVETADNQGRIDRALDFFRDREDHYLYPEPSEIPEILAVAREHWTKDAFDSVKCKINAMRFWVGVRRL